MLSKTFLSLLSVASIAQTLPMDGLDSPILERATGGVVEGALHASAPSSSGTTSGGKAASGDGSSGTSGSSSYTVYSGDGSSWPTQDKWIGDFETMFANNKPIMSKSCAEWNVAPNTDQEISDIHDGIIAATTASGVDARFVLAIIMQESKGCVRVPTSNGGVVNPGLMQDHAGVGCTATPCPTSTILQMIDEGSAGTDSGDGLAQCINQATGEGAAGAKAFYWAARIYNTGSYTAGSDLGTPKWGTSCYSSDIANRLTGWAGSETGCTLPNPN